MTRQELNQFYESIMAEPLFEVRELIRGPGKDVAFGNRYLVYANGHISGFPAQATWIVNHAKPKLDALFGIIASLQDRLDKRGNAGVEA